MPKCQQSPPKWPPSVLARASLGLAERDLILAETMDSEDLLLMALWLEGLPDFSNLDSDESTYIIASQLRKLAKFSKRLSESTQN